jgi:hypothetical protein
MMGKVFKHAVKIAAEAVFLVFIICLMFGGITTYAVDGVTEDGFGSIYANGNTIFIVDYDGSVSTTADTLIYLDSDGNGSFDSAADSVVVLSTFSGNSTAGYDLTLCSVYGGSDSDDVASSKIIMLGGNVFYIYGGGYNGDVAGTADITISGGYVNLVYGGGYYGDVAGVANITISGGSADFVFGGANDMGVTGSTHIVMTDGTVGDIYGGGDYGDITGDVTVEVSGGSVNNVYGGGGYYGTGAVGNDTGVTISGNAAVTNVYGGGCNGEVSGNTGVEVKDTATVTNVHGGGEAAVGGDTNVTISGGAEITYVYGSGKSGAVSGNTYVTINGGTIKSVYGGGANNGHVGGSTYVTVNGGTVTDEIVGGSHSGNVTGSTNVFINSGYINGGGMENGIHNTLTSTNIVGGSYSSGTVGSTNITIDGGLVWNVFGGGGNCHVAGRVHIVMNSGYAKSISGGSVGWGYTGSVLIEFKGGIAEGIDGVGVNGIVTGNTEVIVSGGIIKDYVSGGSTSEGDVYGGDAGGNPFVMVTGGTVQGSVYGVNPYNSITGVATVKIGVDAMVEGDVYLCASDQTVGAGSTIQYEVAFYNGATMYGDTTPQASFYVVENQTAAQPADPAGFYAFDSWVKGDLSEFDFNTPITWPLKLYALWIASLELADGQSVAYTGLAAVYPEGQITNMIDGASYRWQYSTDSGITWMSGMPVNAGTYQLRANAGGAGDYVVATSNIVNLTIDKAVLTATYAGETVAAGQAPALVVMVSGFVNGETAGTAEGYIAPIVTNTNTSAGTYTLTPSGGAALNYSFTYVSGTLTILPVEISLGLADGQSVTYTGQAGVYPGGQISNSGDGTLYEWQYSSDGGVSWVSGMPVNAGTYQVRTSVEGTGVYAPATSNAVTFTIIPAMLTATYAGETVTAGQMPVLAVGVSGFVNGETAGTAAGYISPIVTNTNTSAGTYTLAPSGGAALNYSFTYVSGTLTILPVEISLELAGGQSVTYTGQAAVYPEGQIVNTGGVTLYEWEYSADGGVTWVSGMPVNAGTYQVRASVEGTGVYASAMSNIVNFTIDKAVLTAIYAGETIAAGQVPALVVTVSGFVNGETSGTAAGYIAPIVTNTNTSAGTYMLTPSGGAALNYSFAYVSGILTISSIWDNNVFLPVVISVILLAGAVLTVFWMKKH